MSSSRLFPSTPLVGVSVLLYRGQDIVLIKRGNAPFKGFWSLPGGMVHLGEPLIEAARRELLEETDLSAKNIVHFETFDSIQRNDEGLVESHFVLCVFAGEYDTGTLEKGDDAIDAIWLPNQSIETLQTTPGTSERVARLFNSLARQ
ncbi:MAG: NUDIX hydrolase [Rhodobacteraceae bacterium]|nr:NUDIX hydrolase [Paracoccaceae bacterium]